MTGECMGEGRGEVGLSPYGILKKLNSNKNNHFVRFL